MPVSRFSSKEWRKLPDSQSSCGHFLWRETDFMLYRKVVDQREGAQYKLDLLANQDHGI